MNHRWTLLSLLFVGCTSTTTAASPGQSPAAPKSPSYQVQEESNIAAKSSGESGGDSQPLSQTPLDQKVPGYTAVPSGGAYPPTKSWGILDQPPSTPTLQVPRVLPYFRVVRKVANMVSDRWTQRQVQRRGLHLINVAWEDTGRSKWSSLGPNISDVTLQVQYRNERGRLTKALMPVIRFPNFTDRTADIPANRFWVRVGNHRGQPLRSVPLKQVLRNIRRYVSVPRSIRGSGNLLARRDTHFLVSAQAVFLPVPRRGKATFNPVIFNYQSAPGSPAVLTILVTRQGTSVAVIENKARDRTIGDGQELFFNNAGRRARFTAERRSDVAARIEAKGGPSNEDERSALAQGADCMFLVQVPLRHRHRGVLPGLLEEAAVGGGGGGLVGGGMPMASAKRRSGSARPQSDVERAVLGHGRNLGPYREGSGLALERDPRFPIRITVQFYKATSNGVVSERDLDKVATIIGQVYEHADYVGSLVVPYGDPHRPTEWNHMPSQWFVW